MKKGYDWIMYQLITFSILMSNYNDRKDAIDTIDSGIFVGKQ